jgi:hypothetical protein
VILIVLAVLCLVTVPLFGGRLLRLAQLRVRALWLGPLALALQVVIVTIAPGGSPTLHAAIHVLTYVLIGIFLALNIRIPGAPVIALGALANAIAIVANSGVMPAAREAQRLAGLVEGGGFHNSNVLSHPHLLWLGDIVPVPGPLPNVLSVGDCIIFTGMLVLLHRTCGTTLPFRRRRSLPRAVGDTTRREPQSWLKTDAVRTTRTCGQTANGSAVMSRLLNRRKRQTRRKAGTQSQGSLRDGPAADLHVNPDGGFR